MSAQRQPRGEAKAEGGSTTDKKGVYQPPPWSKTSHPGVPLPGDPVPANEPHTRERFSDLIGARDEENHDHLGAYLGSFSGALMDLWGTRVTEAMKKAGEEAGWSRFQEILKFVAIKTFEWTAAELFTPAGELLLEGIGAKLSEKVVERAIEAGTAAYFEVKTGKMQEKHQESELGQKKGSLDAVTKRWGSLLRNLPTEMMKLLPKPTPYSDWLMNARDEDLADFRLPPLFPHVPDATVEGTVAGLIMGYMHGIEKYEANKGGIGLQRPVPDPADPTRVDYFDDDIVVVRDMKYAQVYAPTEETVDAIAGKVPISQLPIVALYIYQAGGDEAAAQRLLKAYYQVDPTPGQVKDFIEAFGSDQKVVVTRNPAGEMEVSGKGLAGHLTLYASGSGDRELVKLASDVLTWVQGETEYKQQIGAAPDEGVSRLAEPSDLAKKTHYFLQEAGGEMGWAKTMVGRDIAKLVPQKPVDRWSGKADWAR